MRNDLIFGSFTPQMLVISCLALFISVLLGFSEASSSPDNSTKLSHLDQSYWTIGKNMSTARNELTAVELNGKIYAMGGEDIAAGGSQKDTVEVYDIGNDKWIEGTVVPMPLPLDHTASAVYDGNIYVIGGFLKDKVPTDKVFIYDPSKNDWKEAMPLPSPVGAALNAQFI